MFKYLKTRSTFEENTEPIEDADDPVHGFIENKLHAVFGGELSPSEQFQNRHWSQIQK